MFAAGGIAAVAVAFAAWAMIDDGDVPTQQYPSVDGQLGVDLAELEGAIP